jgi:hypothetical protein
VSEDEHSICLILLAFQKGSPKLSECRAATGYLLDYASFAALDFNDASASVGQLLECPPVEFGALVQRPDCVADGAEL